MPVAALGTYEVDVEPFVREPPLGAATTSLGERTGSPATPSTQEVGVSVVVVVVGEPPSGVVTVLVSWYVRV